MASDERFPPVTKATEGPRPTEFGSGGIYATKLGFYLMWLEYLAVSPSYELARRYRSGQYDALTLGAIPADFDQVLAVYDDLGDVQRILFTDWWRDRGLQYFGFQSERPRVRRLATLTAERPDPAPLLRSLDKYVNGKWLDEAQQPTLLAAIPLGLTKAQLARQLNAIVAKYDPDLRQLKPAPPKYPLFGKRQRKETLFRYLMVLWVRSAMHDKELWRVGVRAKVSQTYSRELDADAKPKAGEATYDRMMLSIMTSRAYQRAVLIAENAARGKFPTYAACPHAIQPDLPALYKLIASRRRWKKAQGPKDR
jgi:hypothetical protein